MLEDLDKQASIRALITKVEFIAFNPTVYPDGRRSKREGAGGGSRGRATPRGRVGQGGRQRGAEAGRPWYDKFCKVCELAGKPVHVRTSHNTVDCKPLYTSLRSIYFDDDEEAGEGLEGDDQVGSDEAAQANVEGENS